MQVVVVQARNQCAATGIEALLAVVDEVGADLGDHSIAGTDVDSTSAVDLAVADQQTTHGATVLDTGRAT